MRSILCLLLFALPLASHAQTTVRVGIGTGCTHSPAQLIQALENANDFGQPNRVLLNSGNYTLSNFSYGLIRGNLTIEGGYASCQAASPTGTSTFSSASGRVMHIEQPLAGTRRIVTLRNLILRNGSLGLADFGGGLRLVGNLEVRLENTVVRDNAAGFGAGIHLGSGSAAVETLLRLDQGSSVLDNNAGVGLGGGIFCASGGAVRIGNDAIIEGNAAGSGAGLYLLSGCNRLDLAPNAAATRPISISLNTAGTEVASGGLGGAVLTQRVPITLSASSAIDHGLYMIGNTANRGGALYVSGATVGNGQTLIRLDRALVGGNTARDRGGAFYMFGGVDLLMSHESTRECPFFGLRGCSIVVQNGALNELDSEPGGGALWMESPGRELGNHSRARFFRTQFVANTDNRAAVAYVGAQAELDMEGVIVTGNEATVTPSYMIQAFNSQPLGFRYSTMTGNTGSTLRLIRAEGGITVNIAGSILYNPGTAFNQPIVWNAGDNNTIVHNACAVVHDTDGLPGPGSLQTWAVPPRLDARFTPMGGSPAIDHCDTVPQPVPGLDYYGRPRNVTVASMNNRWGAYDLGAVEQGDIIHYSGFGSRPTN